MKIRELFLANVTRDIPPVVYFHEQTPARVADEVAEYIITGGYREGDPRYRRVKQGIHEQFVSLLQGITRAVSSRTPPELPSSWISGFYGSGKSSFAKLLGLALDGMVLPTKETLAAALWRRDDSPKKAELVEAWDGLMAKVKPVAVVFDIGTVARDDEHIHRAALRQVQAKLGYCAKSSLVAEFELALERDGEWTEFEATAKRALGRPWSEALSDEQAEDHFSHVLHVLRPDRYTEPTTWIDSRAGYRSDGTSVRDTVSAIMAMLDRRANGSTLFLVIDEVSQYVHHDNQRMLGLQSFVQELGQRMKGKAWLLATGQQQLEESADPQGVGKLKDRFPDHLRVHLAATNIRDVVHRRLLKKDPAREKPLRDLFARHRSDLKLHGYKCGEITEEDFVEVYPMLPEQIDLLMQITTQLRARSTRMQGDDHAIRGLLQLLGELFRQRNLAEEEVGTLVTLDEIYEILQSALDADTQTTLARIFSDPERPRDELIDRVAKAVSLLELLQEKGVATTSELVASCLYRRLGAGNDEPKVRDALEMLRERGHLSLSEKLGYKIQSSAGQEWQRERDRIGVTPENRSRAIQDALGGLFEQLEGAPRYKGQSFPWAAFQTDRWFAQDARVKDPRADASITVDVRLVGKQQNPEHWIRESAADSFANKIVWVGAEDGDVEQAANTLQKSLGMLRIWSPRRESLAPERARLLVEEEANRSEHVRKLRRTLEQTLIAGRIYFRGQARTPTDLGTSFASVMSALAEQVLPSLYPHVVDIAVSDKELEQLFEDQLEGTSSKFMEAGLGILSLDAGKYVASCNGPVPQRILKYIRESPCTGTTLLTHFGRPPYGYPADVVRACVAGLLRGGKIRVQPDGRPAITFFRGPDVKDVFRSIKEFRRAEYHPPREDGIKPRDLVAVAQMLASTRGIDVDRERDKISDAVYELAPRVASELRDFAEVYRRLPGRPDIPEGLVRLQTALEQCRGSRQVDEIVTAAVRNLDALRDGLELLAMLRTDVTDAAVEAVREGTEVRDHIVPQLARTPGGLEDAAATAERLGVNLSDERPWRNADELERDAEALRVRYVEARQQLLARAYEQAEAARGRVKQRQGFAALSAELAESVLRPIQDALPNTSPEAIAPTLADLMARFEVDLGRAESDANDRLDEALAQLDEAQVVKVETRVRGREVKSREQLQEVFREIEERVGPMLDAGKRVRLL
ncbi:MAG TPA: BREX system P-loop protein BrxC [Nannocystaceae bacterium]|nr:BREX system P-loop protein BrxC [Nannocystaceae bacterium]